MSIKAVTYYEVRCDDCLIGTVDLWNDYAAWSDLHDAAQEWVDYDGWTPHEVAEDSLALCDTHAPRCLCGNVQSDGTYGVPLGACEDCDEQVTP